MAVNKEKNHKNIPSRETERKKMLNKEWADGNKTNCKNECMNGEILFYWDYLLLVIMV